MPSSSSSKPLISCSTKRLPAIFAWSLLLLTSFTYGIIVLPEITRILNMMIFIPISHCLLFTFLCSNFLLATFLDPGIYEQSLKNEYSTVIHSDDKDDDHPYSPPPKLVQVKDGQVYMKYCSTCKFFRPPRCSHCSICERCIDSFDHHCPWLNNCVARRNYRYFFQFLCLLCVHMILIFSFCLYYIMFNRNSSLLTTSLSDSLQSITTTTILSSSRYVPLTGFSVYRFIVCIILLIIIGLMVIPIGGLTSFHIYLISKGRTTNEQVTKKYREQGDPFNYGCIMNFFRILCLPLYPKLTDLKVNSYNVDVYNQIITQKTQQIKNKSTNRVVYKGANNKVDNNGAINNTNNNKLKKKLKTNKEIESDVESNDKEQDDDVQKEDEPRSRTKKQSTLQQTNVHVNPLENHVNEKTKIGTHKIVTSSKRHSQINNSRHSTSTNNHTASPSTNSLKRPIMIPQQQPLVTTSSSSSSSTSSINERKQQRQKLIKQQQSMVEDPRQTFHSSFHRSVSNMSLSSKCSYDNVEDSETIYNENDDDGSADIIISGRKYNSNNHKLISSVSNIQYYNDYILHKPLRTKPDGDNASNNTTNSGITLRNESYRQAHPVMSFSYDYPSHPSSIRHTTLTMSQEQLPVGVRKLDGKHYEISV
ncbi:unnamed protein product [Didymodactylos carnosus]|uniref:Palmitoyltransferase n=1 Tax=Didymodactylos carnosus TaxID=1234261 RepID=A0A814GV75_9BILA|nr:unnamed protein product [Didymodactylos carnosus]CAF1001764.1 unnamed protein product [Didymodactylos carnosus]CAF3566495.1 unnamed protein product [Didymodactylos carnosus]CAF3773144.1 unnamed protein product [Didymodactylos carnosus]